MIPSSFTPSNALSVVPRAASGIVARWHGSFVCAVDPKDISNKARLLHDYNEMGLRAPLIFQGLQAAKDAKGQLETSPDQDILIITNTDNTQTIKAIHETFINDGPLTIPKARMSEFAELTARRLFWNASIRDFALQSSLNEIAGLLNLSFSLGGRIPVVGIHSSIYFDSRHICAVISTGHLSPDLQIGSAFRVFRSMTSDPSKKVSTRDIPDKIVPNFLKLALAPDFRDYETRAQQAVNLLSLAGYSCVDAGSLTKLMEKLSARGFELVAFEEIGVFTSR